MTALKRILVVLTANGILAVLVDALNRWVSGYSVFLFVPALFLVYPALFLPLHQGLPTLLVTTALFEALSPLPFGALSLFAAAGAILIDRLRHRLRSEHLHYAVGTTMVVNGVFFLYLSLLFPVPGLGRLLVDLLLSAVFIAVSASWFFSLQHQSLNFLKIRPHSDEF